MRTVRSRTSALLSALALVLAGTLTACGDGGDGDAAGGHGHADHNAADVAFASQMVPHHEQALEMVDLADGRRLDPDVRTLMHAIEHAQGPEIETMNGWLEEWGEEVPSSAGHGSSGHESSGHAGTAGMVSEHDLEHLAEADDADFQAMWLEHMIEHHEGAVEMARAEQRDGEHSGAVALAGDIVTAQQREIAQMRRMLD